MADGLAVDGLKELARDLRRIDAQLGKELAKNNRQFGGRILQDAKGRMARLSPGGSVASSGAASLRLRASATQASIVGPASNPFVRALEFGMNRHFVFGRPRPASTMRRRVFQPHNPEGYGVRATVRDWVQSGRADEEYARSLEVTLRRLGWR